VPTAVVRKCMRDAANNTVFIRNLGERGQIFADANAGDVGVDRMEGPAILRGGIGLQVERFLVRWPAGQPDEDDGGFVRCLFRTARTEMNAGPGEGDRTKFQSTTPIRPAAGMLRYHGGEVCGGVGKVVYTTGGARSNGKANSEQADP
jgi:hypothetical protein